MKWNYEEAPVVGEVDHEAVRSLYFPLHCFILSLTSSTCSGEYELVMIIVLNGC